MTTSGTYDFYDNFENVDLIVEAYERIGRQQSELSANDFESARRSIQMCFSDFCNRGPNLWTFDLVSTALTANQTFVQEIPQTVMVSQSYIRQGTGITQTDYILTPISRADFSALPNKNQTSNRPTQYYFQRTIDPTIWLWPLPQDATCTLFYYRFQIQQDFGSFTDTMDAPNRWFDAFASNLAWRLSMKFAPERQADLKAAAIDAFNAAAAEDTENVPMRITPNMYGARWS